MDENKKQLLLYVVEMFCFRRARKITKSDYQRYVYQSVRMEQLGFHFMKYDICIFFSEIYRENASFVEI